MQLKSTPKGVLVSVATMPSRVVSQEEVDAVIRTVQDHLNKEASNRRLPDMQPQDLCDQQKRDLAAAVRRSFQS